MDSVGLDWDQEHEQSKFKVFSFLRINPGWMGMPKAGWFEEELC